MNVQLSLLGIEHGDLTVLDAKRRLYVGLSRDGSYFHVVSPSQVDVMDADGNVAHRAGELVCNCRGGIYHGSCYRLRQAEAFEAGQRGEDVAWLDAAPGELVEAFGK